ncbi:MbtH family protein [Sphingomonas sp. RHCKR7]|uniref:MbtH family protein n=1 Tax=Sphingomonas folli TaxID=2862497 RepID=UPI001C67F184|nr:MbtH family protein [Sphingomonas folli]MBW6528628.1 MbtH family protein [Sphingomonas folli]
MTTDRPNPFDDEDASFLVLHNMARQWSLWPVFAPVPVGWSRAFGPESRGACLAYVEERWAGELRPGARGAARAH